MILGRYKLRVISRYSRPEMAALWAPERKFRKWLEIEIAAAEGWAEVGRIPKSAIAVIRKKATFDVARIAEIEKEVKHDVIAFLTHVARSVGPEARYLHLGLTSSDILDTCFSLQLKEAGEKLVSGLDQFLQVLKRRAEEHRRTPMVGRSHGIHAEPITFGVKIASWYAEMRRHRERLVRGVEQVSVGKISGAVGVYGHLDPRVEAYVCRKLGLRPDSVSTQVVARDHYAEFFAACALTATGIERIATEIRHLQRTEVLEAEEYFSAGQKGSSAMPHKRNPVLSENLTGLARLVRSYLVPALEDMPLWHERDISHSSVERVIAPDATILLDFMLARATELVDKLVVYPQRMAENLKRMGKLVYSEGVMIGLIESGMTREEAYHKVQAHAMAAWEEGIDFEVAVRGDAAITERLASGQLDEIFKLENHFKHIDTILKRTLTP